MQIPLIARRSSIDWFVINVNTQCIYAFDSLHSISPDCRTIVLCCYVAMFIRIVIQPGDLLHITVHSSDNPKILLDASLRPHWSLLSLAISNGQGQRNSGNASYYQMSRCQLLSSLFHASLWSEERQRCLAMILWIDNTLCFCRQRCRFYSLTCCWVARCGDTYSLYIL